MKLLTPFILCFKIFLVASYHLKRNTLSVEDLPSPEVTDEEINRMDKVSSEKTEKELKTQILLIRRAINQLKHEINKTQEEIQQQEMNQLAERRMQNVSESSKTGQTIYKEIKNETNFISKMRFKDLVKIGEKMNKHIESPYFNKDIKVLTEVVDSVNKTNTIKKDHIYKELVKTGIKESEFIINKLQKHPKDILEYQPKYNQKINTPSRKVGYKFLQKGPNVVELYKKYNYIPSFLPRNFSFKTFSSSVLGNSKLRLGKLKSASQKKNIKPINKVQTQIIRKETSQKVMDGPIDISNLLVE